RTPTNESRPSKIEIALPTYISIINFDSGVIIKPSFENLHLLLAMNTIDFQSTMDSYYYSFSQKNQFYVSEKTKNCCYSITKDSNSVSMIFTKYITTDLEEFFIINNIKPTLDRGFKKYIYTLNNQDYIFLYQGLSDHVSIVLMYL